MTANRLVHAGLWMGVAYGVACLAFQAPALTQSRVGEELLTWALLIALVWAFRQGWQAVSVWSEHPPSRTERLGFWLLPLLFGILAILTPAFHSTDLLGYINRGWQQAHYHVNPYVVTVGQLAGWAQDPMLTDHWVTNPCPYGFLFAHWARVLAGLGLGSLATTALVFKAANLGVLLGLTALLVRLAPRFGVKNPWLSGYLLAWNPLIVLHHLTNGHNDLLMAGLTLGAVATATARRTRWTLLALPLLMGAVWVKYAALVALPWVAGYVRRARGLAVTWTSALLALGLSWMIAAPYAADWRHFQWSALVENAGVARGSIQSGLNDLVDFASDFLPALKPWLTGLSNALSKGFWATFAGLWSFHAVATFRRWCAATTTPDPAELVAWVLGAQFVLVVLTSSKFYPWYLGMFLPLVGWLPEGHRLRRAVVAVGVGQLFAFTFLGQAHMLDVALMTLLPLAWVFRDCFRRPSALTSRAESNAQPV